MVSSARSCSCAGRATPSPSKGVQWRRRRRHCSTCRMRSLFVLGFLIGVCFTACLSSDLVEDRPSPVTVESFVSSLDSDGDGEICEEEASKFLESVLDTCAEEMLAEAPYADREVQERSRQDISMADLLNDHQLNLGFSYGGSSISSAEMSDHLGHMLTGDRVVAWVVHGLRLPQYAEAFREHSIDGLDFPALLSDNGAALRDELGIRSALHRSKIQSALVRQIFGIGRVPDPPLTLTCQALVGPDGAHGIALQWKPPTEPGIPPLHKYLVQRRRLQGAGVKSAWENVGESSDESLVDGAGGAAGAEFEFRVQSWGGHGPSAWANVTGCHVPSESRSGSSGALQKAPEPGMCLPGASQGTCRLRPTSLAVEEETGEVASGQADTAQRASNSNSGVQKPGNPTASFTPLQGALDNAAAASQSTASTSRQQQDDGTVLGFVWSINGGILVMGLLSRSSLLYRSVSSAWAVAGRAIKRLMPSTGSASPTMRRLAESSAHFGSALNSLCLAILAAMGLVLLNPGEEGSIHGGSSRSSGRSSSGNSFNLRSVSSAPNTSQLEINPAYPTSASTPCSNGNGNGGSFSAANQEKKGSLLLSREKSTNSKGVMSNSSSTSAPLGHSLEESSSSSEGSKSKSGSDKQQQQQDLQRAATVKAKALVRFSSNDRSGSSKHRCYADGCSVHFNTVAGIMENMRKHYCCDCQNWYCSRHTRIASHSGSLCRLDSQCRCFSCFARLPADRQLYLDAINKLPQAPHRAAPDPVVEGRTAVRSEATRARQRSRERGLDPGFGEGAARGPQGAGSAHEGDEGVTGGRQHLPSTQFLEDNAASSGKMSSNEGAGGALEDGGEVRRARSDCFLLGRTEERKDGIEAEGAPDGARKKDMKKSVSNACVAEARREARPESVKKDDTWLNSVFLRLSASGAHGDNNGRSDHGEATLIVKPAPQEQHGTLERADRGHSVSGDTARCEPAEEGNKGFFARGLSSPSAAQRASLRPQPSFGRSSSLRTDSIARMRGEAESSADSGTPVAHHAPAGGSNSLHQRSSSFEHLRELDGEQVPEVVTGGASRKAANNKLKALSGVLKKSFHPFSSLLAAPPHSQGIALTKKT